MNHHQRKLLHAIFAHPLNANLEMKDIVNVLNGLGAEIDTKSKSRSVGLRPRPIRSSQYFDAPIDGLCRR